MHPAEHLARSLARLGVRPAGPLGIACSGGADSVALLRLAAAVHRGRVHVLHVDHGLRDGSDADADFVRAAAGELGLHCDVLRPLVEVSRGDSVEAVARRARYAALADAAERHGLRHVATAHTRDDQAETVLLGVLRGTGAAGIAAVHGMFVRPLLDVGRDELRAWLTAGGHGWREDPTNDDPSFERNWVRHELMPVVGARRPGAAKAVARLARRIRADAAVLDALAEDVFARASVDGVGILFERGDMDALPDAVTSRVVCLALRELGVEPRAALVDEVVDGDSPRVRHGAVVVHRTREGLALVRDPLPVPAPLEVGSLRVSSPDWRIDARLGDPARPRWRWRTPLPSGNDVVVRPRRPGDRVRTAAGTRKLQDVLVDAKVPAFVRDLVGVVAVDDDPVAVIGLVPWPGDQDRPVGRPCEGARVLDVEPHPLTWSSELVWSRASA